MLINVQSVHRTSFSVIYYTRKFPQNFISSRDGPVKVQKQGRDENMQENCPIMQQWQKKDKKATLYLQYIYAADVGQFSCLFSAIVPQ